ncbi:MAG: glycosyltransferase family 4 protein [Nanoarchaeota archaeon]|nr:glycosyltransferase family 4 protein [DPANN group archaeon]MBL7116978.1 glycosyltransferase family 4 protein [Nanoarchaeota archaeon]
MTNKISLIEVTQAYDDVGGLEIVLKDLNNSLVKEGYDISIVYFTPDKNSVEKLPEVENIHYYPVYKDISRIHYFNPSTILNLFKTLNSLLSEKQADIMHIHSPCVPIGPVSVLMANRHRVPVVVTYHGAHRRKMSTELVASTCTYVTSYFSTINLGVSSSSCDAMVSNPRVIGDPVDLEFFSREKADPDRFRESFNLNGEKIFLYPARFYMGKGQQDLVSVAKRLNGKINYKFLLFGSHIHQDFVNFLKDEVEVSGLSDRFIISTPLSREDLRDAYSASDVMVFPSYSEGLGLISIEAMSMGVPVVAYNSGGIPDVVLNNKTGLLVEKGNTDELANSLKMLVYDSQTRSFLIENGRRFVKEKFSLDSFINKQLSVYEEVLSQPN